MKPTLSISLFAALLASSSNAQDGLIEFRADTPAVAAEVNGNFSFLRQLISAAAETLAALETDVADLGAGLGTVESELETVATDLANVAADTAAAGQNASAVLGLLGAENGEITRLNLRGPSTGSRFDFFDFDAGGPFNTQLISAWTGNDAGPQVRYGLSPQSEIFWDVGLQGTTGSFVIEGPVDDPHLTVTTTGRVFSGDFEGFGNHQTSTRVAEDSDAINVAIFGSNEGKSGFEVGVFGRTESPDGFGVFSQGDLGSSGVKSFVNPHPTDASLEIRFACLEGNESGTYFRGKATLVSGSAVVEVPEDFRLATEAEGLTVQLTTVGQGDAWIEAYSLEAIELAGDTDLEVHYVVNGVRKGFGGLETIRANRSFRPMTAGQPYASELPTAVRDMLVANGTLNPDYTPNLATAGLLGWKVAPQGK